MNIDNALSLWDWPSVLGLVVVGIAFGWIAVPLAWPVRAAAHEEPPVAMAAFLMVLMFVVAFFFLIMFRYLTVPTPIAERTIGTALELLVFAFSAGIGLAIRR